jgi:hypothetical protein
MRDLDRGLVNRLVPGMPRGMLVQLTASASHDFARARPGQILATHPNNARSLPPFLIERPKLAGMALQGGGEFAVRVPVTSSYGSRAILGRLCRFGVVTDSLLDCALAAFLAAHVQAAASSKRYPVGGGPA